MWFKKKIVLFPLFLMICLLSSCSDSNNDFVEPDLKQVVNDLGKSLMCEDILIYPIDGGKLETGYRVVFKNSKYSDQIVNASDKYHEYAIEFILRGISKSENLPDSLIIQFDEGLLSNEIGVSRLFGRHYGQFELNHHYSFLNSPESVLIYEGNKLLASNSYEKIDSLCMIYKDVKQVQAVISQLQGLSYLKELDTIQAVKSFKTALVEDSTYLESHASLTVLFLEKNDSSMAMLHAKKMLMIDSLDPRSYYYMARLVKNEDLTKACKLYQKSKKMGLDSTIDDLFLDCDL